MKKKFANMDSNLIPEVFDAKYYRKTNFDLFLKSDLDLAAHFREWGIKEGRTGSAAALREVFLKYVHNEKSILEIGPFCNPAIKGKHVKYFDVLDETELSNRARTIGYKNTTPPKIDFVSPIGDLSVVQEKFSAVMSSHAVEHQPDLIRHLQKVSAVLELDGKYYLLIPDKRYCFDALIAESTIAEIIDAFERRVTKHSCASVIEHRALTTHNDRMRHWNGDHTDTGYDDSIRERVSNAVNEFIAAKGDYIDVHAWQFTPDSFENIIQILYELGFVDLKPYRVYQTPRGRLEFASVLVKSRPNDSVLVEKIGSDC